MVERHGRVAAGFRGDCAAPMWILSRTGELALKVALDHKHLLDASDGGNGLDNL